MLPYQGLAMLSAQDYRRGAVLLTNKSSRYVLKFCQNRRQEYVLQMRLVLSMRQLNGGCLTIEEDEKSSSNSV